MPSISAMTEGFLRLAGFEDFRHPRQTTGDVLRTGHFAGRLGQQGARRDLIPFVDFDVGLFRQIIEVEDFAAGVFQHDLRVQVALVLHDHAAQVARGVFFQAHRFALDHVLVADLAADFGQNRDAMRVPLANDLARLDLLILVDRQVRAGGNFVFLDLATLGVDQHDFTVAGEHHLLTGVVAARLSIA